MLSIHDFDYYGWTTMDYQKDTKYRNILIQAAGHRESSERLSNNTNEHENLPCASYG